MTSKRASQLPTPPTDLTGSETAIVVIGGLFYRTTVDGLRQGIATATPLQKGLLSAADKAQLDGILPAVAALTAPPSTPIISASTITVPPNRFHITLSGTTPITVVQGLVPRKLYTFSYPAGAGLTFLGETLQAGDVVSVIDD
jgi:hypothetical protein